MKLYIGMNGDISAKIYIFAKNQNEARKIAKKKIKNEELEDHFPVLTFESHKIEEGIIEYMTHLYQY